MRNMRNQFSACPDWEEEPNHLLAGNEVVVQIDWPGDFHRRRESVIGGGGDGGGGADGEAGRGVRVGEFAEAAWGVEVAIAGLQESVVGSEIAAEDFEGWLVEEIGGSWILGAGGEVIGVHWFMVGFVQCLAYEP